MRENIHTLIGKIAPPNQQKNISLKCINCGEYSLMPIFHKIYPNKTKRDKVKFYVKCPKCKTKFLAKRPENRWRYLKKKYKLTREEVRKLKKEFFRKTFLEPIDLNDMQYEAKRIWMEIEEKAKSRANTTNSDNS